VEELLDGRTWPLSGVLDSCPPFVYLWGNRVHVDAVLLAERVEEGTYSSGVPVPFVAEELIDFGKSQGIIKNLSSSTHFIEQVILRIAHIDDGGQCDKQVDLVLEVTVAVGKRCEHLGGALGVADIG
jgi:hypothetical protein